MKTNDRMDKLQSEIDDIEKLLMELTREESDSLDARFMTMMTHLTLIQLRQSMLVETLRVIAKGPSLGQMEESQN